MREFMAVAKALADATRVRILLALRRGELCVCQITELLGLAPSTVSKHLSLLHHAGLIVSTKRERWVYYRLPDHAVTPAAEGGMAWVNEAAGESDQATADAKRLKQIMSMDLQEICRRQCR
jgi:DNA-binding transcriptional ArsR family regulator